MLKNIASLYVLQILSSVVPLLLTPYLTRVLGVEMFGVMAICVSVVAYLSLLSNWGFDLSASQQVAQASQDPERLRRIFWDTLLAKVALGAIGFLLMGPIVALTPTLRQHWPVMLASGLALFSAMFSVNWFLQGLEKMGAFALATLVGRLGSVPATFLLVHKPRDAAIAAAVQAMATCVSAGASIYTASRCAPLWPVRLSPRGAFEQIAGGAHLFLSTAAISLYTYTNILAVGLIAGPAQAGLFDGADRMKRATQVLTGPISNAAFPRINRMMVHERHRVRATMMWLLIVQGGISLALTLGLYVTAPWSTVLLLGRAYASAVPIAQVLSINIFLIGVSNVLGLNMMLPLGMKRAFTTIIVGSGLINLLLLSVLVHPFGALGAAEAVTITEGVVTVGMAAWLIMRGGGRAGIVVASEPDVAVQHSADA